MAYSQDDGFHEIQLNGKQLVFLFMAATVVSVVIFLCGVLVGRGVRAERGDLIQSATADVSNEVAPAPPPGATPAPAPTATTGDPSAAASPSLDELSYFNRLEKPNAPAEALKPAKPAAAPEPKTAERTTRALPAPPAPAATREPTGGRETAIASRETPGARREAPVGPAAQGWVVQVAALNIRGDADAVAKRLATKGYATYVDALPDRTPALFRVRVGAFKTKREAEAMAAKLKKEEQFSPWVTR